MDDATLKKLAKQGVLAPMRSGRQGVPVSLQVRSNLTEPTMVTRRAALRSQFERISASIESLGAEVDLDALSVTGQTVTALLPVDHYDDIQTQLLKQSVRVDVLVDRQVV